MSETSCSYCGTVLYENSRYCPRCGATAGWTPPSAVGPQTAYQEQPREQPRYQEPPYQQPPHQQPPYQQPPYQQPYQQAPNTQPYYQPPAYAASPAMTPVYVERKDKTVAILLAIFLGGWTWLYTYKKDSWKFWLSFALNLTLFNPLWTWLLLFIPNFGLHIWAIIDVAVKPQYYYDNFPNA